MSQEPPPASSSSPRIRSALWATGAAGLLLAVVLIARNGLPAILRVLDIAGWRLLWLVPLRVVPLALDASGWRRLLRAAGIEAPSRVYLTWAAIVRESVGTLLPVARVGGEVVGVRLLLRRGVAMAAAGASVVVELTLTMATQVTFAVIGLLILTRYPTAGMVPRLIADALVASAIVVVVFAVIQHRWGLFRLFERLLAFIVRAGSDSLRRLVAASARIDQTIRTLYRDPRAVGGCAAWQLAGMFAGSLEIWIALRLLGQHTSVGRAVVIESLTLALQSATFMVPAGLGTQEGGFVLFGAAVGLSPQVALALSLARRARQLGLGVPALVSWYWTERRPDPVIAAGVNP